MYLKKYNLKNKVAVVSGAGKGLGKACAIALAEAGSNLVIISRTKKDLDQVSRIAKKYKVKCKSYICDINNYNHIKEIINQQSRIDILINNAGTNIPEYFEKVNRKKIGGSIVNMSSQMGHVSGPKRSVYSMTKFGIEGLTKGMALDLAKYNIRVNTVCPTFVVTSMTKKFLKDRKFKKDMLSSIPLGRFAELPEISSAVVFLASDAASMITGTSLLVDGGWTAR